MLPEREYVNIARRGLLQAGWPVTVPGITLDRRCTSGMDALVIGAMQIQTGNSKIVVAGGVESMSTAEFYFPGNLKSGIGRGNGISFPDAPRGHGSLNVRHSSLRPYSAFPPMHQPAEKFGEIVSNVAWAENVAKELGITRDECDKWALRSHQNAVAAQKTANLKIILSRSPSPRIEANPGSWIPMKAPAPIPVWKPLLN